MSESILEILEYGSEGYLVDFKQEQYPLGKYPKKHEFLKDISAMANHPKDEDKYIIIGAIEKNGMAESFKDVSELTDQAKYQQYLDSYIEPSINFEYKPILFKEKQLAYFRIFDNEKRPYLFKKKVQIPKEKDKSQIVYNEGDGFIRAGTGTRRMVRSDFERVYKKRFLQKDRKNDLKIHPTLNYFEEFPFDDEITVMVLDLDIENTSNKSIDFDIELKIQKKENYAVTTSTEFQRKMNEQSSPFGMINPVLGNLHVESEEDELDFVFRRTKLRNMRTAVNIPQVKTDKDIFDKEILLIFNNKCKVAFEVIIRSDDFTGGAVIQNFEINNENQ